MQCALPRIPACLGSPQLALPPSPPPRLAEGDAQGSSQPLTQHGSVPFLETKAAGRLRLM